MLSHQSYFRFKSIGFGFINNVVRINYYVDNDLVGFLHYTKFPLFSYYVIHSFYVYPRYRRKQYGTRLLNYACNYLGEIGSQKIYIQPGPYELSNSSTKDIHNIYRVSIHQLILFYKKMGFDFVSKYTSMFARILYTIIGIDEDPQVLMVKSLKSL